MYLLSNILHRIIQVMILIVIAQVVLSYFMSPFHPVRRFIDGIVNPLLTPIRRFLPMVGGLDFSPLVLIILLQLLDYLQRLILLSL